MQEARDHAVASLNEVQQALVECTREEKDLTIKLTRQIGHVAVSESAEVAVLKVKLNKARTTLKDLKVSHSVKFCIQTHIPESVHIQVPTEMEQVQIDTGRKVRELQGRLHDIQSVKSALHARAKNIVSLTLFICCDSQSCW